MGEEKASGDSGRAPGTGPLGRIPRSTANDYEASIVARRLAACEAAAEREFPHLGGLPVPLESARGKIENLIGYCQVPLGIAGPLLVHGEAGLREVYVPMATTEGALVASYSRGMGLLAAGGGARARVLAEGLTQNPVLVYAHAAAAAEAARKATELLPEFQALTTASTNHGVLQAVRPQVLGRRLVVSFVFTTGDAIGINMAASATDACARVLQERTGAEARYLHGQDVEKRANAAALVQGRGRSVVADVVVPRAELARRARVTPEDLVAVLRTYAVGFAQLGTQNWLVQAANGLAAVMLACGQDVAYVTESATGLLDFDVTPGGDLYASVTLPSLLVGTVGGGSGQGTAAECLDLLGVRGGGGARAFAEILAATVLAGDLSLMASFSAHEFVAAHERLGRNRPASPESSRGPEVPRP